MSEYSLDEPGFTPPVPPVPPSSSESSADGRRKCIACPRRMSRKTADCHTLCVNCMFLEDVSRHEKLLLCGDFNCWLDTPASKPYTEEFVGLLNANNIKNFVMMPTHVSDHTLDLVLAPTESDFVGGIEISPIDSDISDHALLTFALCFSRPPTYRKTITFRNYGGLDANVAANVIETDLVGAVAQGQTSVQLTNSYNVVLSSARD